MLYVWRLGKQGSLSMDSNSLILTLLNIEGWVQQKCITMLWNMEETMKNVD